MCHPTSPPAHDEEAVGRVSGARGLWQGGQCHVRKRAAPTHVSVVAASGSRTLCVLCAPRHTFWGRFGACSCPCRVPSTSVLACRVRVRVLPPFGLGNHVPGI